MWIVCLADNSHEIPRLISMIFFNKNVVCCSFDWHFKGDSYVLSKGNMWKQEFHCLADASNEMSILNVFIFYESYFLFNAVHCSFDWHFKG